MVLRSLVVLGAAVAVATSPSWLGAIGATVGESGARTPPLAFSVYWIVVPAALALALSWIHEMGAQNSGGLQALLASGGFNPSGPQADTGERRAAWTPQERLPNSGGSATSVWKRLEVDFREILEFGADLDAQWKRTSSYADSTESWTLSGAYEEQRISKKFNELAGTAGRMLIEWPGYTPPLAGSTMKHPVASERWLCTLRDREIKTETWAPGQITEDGAVTGHVHGGVIHEAIEASIELCVQLTLEESLEDRSGPAEGSLGARLILTGSDT
jgi:hypothetical protein